MADDKFKLPQSSYEELTKIIKAYGHFNEPADLTEISKLGGVHTTIVSRNNGFLVAVGILEAGARKVLSSIGRELSRALEHEMPDEMRQSWQRVVFDCDFLSKAIAAIKIRSGMDQQTLEAHIAYSAGQPKKSQFMTGARTVIDILKAAEVIREVDGKYLAGEFPSLESGVLPSVGMSAGISKASGYSSVLKEASSRRVATSMAAFGDPGRVINFNINVNCSPEDLEGLGEKLRRVIRQLDGDEGNNEGGQPQ